ncbi:response regulator [Methylobacterium radiodurans]|uniref:response regulator n=1 Tax=Methylobacterium radiodurans TaxID=2202828 RepID=UPI0026CE4144
MAQTAEAAPAEIEVVPSRFDAVYSDIGMPSIDGIGIAERMRELHPGLPGVLTTGYSDVLARDDALGFALVRKPYSAEQVAKALKAAADRKARNAVTSGTR